MRAMYSFPYPRETDIAPLRVPVFEASSTYSFSAPEDFGDFCNIAIAAETQYQTSFAAASHGPPPRRSMWAAIAQTWLFFGLASEALGRDTLHEEFFDINSRGGLVTDSTDLRIPRWFHDELERHWDTLRNECPTDEYVRKRRDLERCITLAWTTVGILDLQGDKEDSNLSLVLLSVHMLLYMIAGVTSGVKILKASSQLSK
jgi:hypothetical protein